MNNYPLKMSEIIATDRLHSDIDSIIETKSAISPRGQKADIICFPIINWDFRHQRTQHLITRLAMKGHRIFHLTSSVGPLDAEFVVKKIIDNVYELQLSTPELWNIYQDIYDNEKLDGLLRSVDSARRSLDIDALSWVVFPTWTYLVLELRRRYGWKVIYDCLDSHAGFIDINRIRVEEERLLIKEADLIVTSSQVLYNHAVQTKNERIIYKNAKEVSNDTVLLLRNACEFQHFSMLPPNNSVNLKKPVIGYIGAIKDWLDTSLLEYLATRRSDWNFLFIGDVENANNSEIARLRTLPNVHFLGEKIYHDLPRFIYHFDVCIIPFKITPLIEATNPVKFYEYLASGKPVVATMMHELKQFDKLCYLAENYEDFLRKIEIALEERGRELQKNRTEFAKQNTWRQRISELYPHIESLQKFGILFR